MKELKVDAINQGTVIDHISPGKAFKLIELLNLKETDQIMIGTNLSSKKMGKKDVIKIENRELTEEELNCLALIDSSATISIIRDYNTIKKTTVKLPKKIIGLITCPNPTCITNEETITTRFNTRSSKPLKIQCSYCEKTFAVENISKYINLKKWD